MDLCTSSIMPLTITMIIMISRKNIHCISITISIMPFEVPLISMRRNDFSRWGWASLVYMTMTILIRPLNSTAPSALKLSVPLKALGNQATTAGKIKCTCCEWFPVGSLIYAVQPQGSNSHPASQIQLPASFHSDCTKFHSVHSVHTTSTTVCVS